MHLNVVFFYLLTVFLSFLSSIIVVSFSVSTALVLVLGVTVFVARDYIRRTSADLMFYLCMFILFLAASFNFPSVVYSYGYDIFFYSLITVVFNLSFPYFASLLPFGDREVRTLAWVVCVIILIATWQYFAVNYLYGVEYIYNNERIKSPLFQGEARIPSIFVSANNFSVFLVTCLSYVLFVSRKGVLFKFICTVLTTFFIYYTYVRKSYILLFLLFVYFLYTYFLSSLPWKIKFGIVLSSLILLFVGVVAVDGYAGEGLLSTQTLGSRLAQWDFYFSVLLDSGLMNLFFGGFILQSSFETLGFYFEFLDNNFLMVFMFGGVLFLVSYLCLLFKLLVFFNRNYYVSPSWAAFGIFSFVSFLWVGLFSNVIDNHEVSVVLMTSMWVSYRKLSLIK